MKNLFKTAALLVVFLLGITQYVVAQSPNNNFENTALIIIDVQNDYFPGGKMTLVNADEAGEKAKQLLAAYRAHNRPVIHIQHISTNAGATFFLPNTQGAKISSYVTPNSGEKVIVKHYPNSFRETDLLQYLKSIGVKNLVICGMMTDVCVVSTTRAAMDLGFNNTLISDAIATRDRMLYGKTVSAAKINKSYLAGLSSLGNLYARVRTTQQFINGQ
ncbi:cysteine hydrolase family protein [Chryseobacterium polytrichastri]|uniref:Nicotinamidase-related amidase n=1 Tax=Chryseobacterium polytrichastri TaxID=1302687 RepID=A0A1M6PMW0_9FLAO|nr:cysteine hydrolase family protein [Chryseobacterium polytrichastri]SHK09286.1 Nicotinamidase-related amidase [Chryseobacterium polytrichastri]